MLKWIKEDVRLVSSLLLFLLSLFFLFTCSTCVSTGTKPLKQETALRHLTLALALQHEQRLHNLSHSLSYICAGTVHSCTLKEMAPMVTQANSILPDNVLFHGSAFIKYKIHIETKTLPDRIIAVFIC